MANIGGAIALTATVAVAQPASGALFLLLPTGGRAVGLAESVVADTLGSESLWWNPGALARVAATEVGVQGSRTAFFNGSALSWVRPSRRVGTLALGINFLDAGTQPLTNNQGVELGQIALRNWVVAAAYATSVTDRVDIGLTYKFLQTRFDCSGLCQDVSVYSSSTSAVDIGLRTRLPGALPIALGAAVRNLGPRFQINDREQADPLPIVVDVGLVGEVPAVARRAPGATARWTAGLAYLPTASADPFIVRAGAEAAWQGRYVLRGGWSVQGGDGGGPTAGLGLAVDRLVIDLGARFGGVSSALGQTPTYVSLRFAF